MHEQVIVSQYTSGAEPAFALRHNRRLKICSEKCNERLHLQRQLGRVPRAPGHEFVLCRNVALPKATSKSDMTTSPHSETVGMGRLAVNDTNFEVAPKSSLKRAKNSAFVHDSGEDSTEPS